MTEYNVITKQCRQCKTVKPLTTEFYNQDKRIKDGFIASCKECKKIYQADHYARNAERKKNYQSNIRKTKPDLIRERNKQYFNENKEKCRQWNRDCHKRNAEAYNERKRKYNALNQEKRRKSGLIYRQKNKAKILKRVVDWHRNKRNNDPMYRVRLNIGRAIRHRLKTDKQGVHVFELIGYSAKELKQHLEKQFLSGMNWDNYGKWHIDHIIPASKFIVKSIQDEELKRCWALANLRPIWATENLRKSNKIIYLI